MQGAHADGQPRRLGGRTGDSRVRVVFVPLIIMITVTIITILSATRIIETIIAILTGRKIMIIMITQTQA